VEECGGRGSDGVWRRGRGEEEGRKRGGRGEEERKENEEVRRDV